MPEASIKAAFPMPVLFILVLALVAQLAETTFASTQQATSKTHTHIHTHAEPSFQAFQSFRNYLAKEL
jgi:hypothetical protein